MTSDQRRPRQLVFVEGNSPADADPEVALYGVRPYPYLHMVPPRALAVDGQCLLAPYARDVRISCDLAFVVGRDVFRITEAQAAESIAGYAAMVSILDTSCVARLRDPAERERVLAGALRRWEESTCSIGEPGLLADLSAASAAESWLEVPGRSPVRGTTASLRHRAAAVLAFASHLMPVTGGAIFGLGSTGATVTLAAGDRLPPGLPIRARIHGLPELSVHADDVRTEAEWAAFVQRF